MRALPVALLFALSGCAIGGSADPVATDLVTYLRLAGPGPVTPEEIDSFISGHSDWPVISVLTRRREELLATLDGETLRDACAARPPVTAPIFVRCIVASREARPSLAAALARRAWAAAMTFTPSEEAMLAGAADFSRSEQWERFDRLAWADAIPAAARQISRLAPPDRPRAVARLALKRDDPSAATVLATLAPLPIDPGIMLDRLRHLRRVGRDADAVALWLQDGAEAEVLAGDHAAAFWAERDRLIRHRLREGDPEDAFLVAAAASGPTETLIEARFLAGFIALRALHDPDRAALFFAALASLSPAALTQSRAHYWLARCDPSKRAAEDEKAAAYPLTFYGQRAIEAEGGAVGDRIRAIGDPARRQDEAWLLPANEMARASLLLSAWGEPGRGRPFLLRAAAIDPERAPILAHLARDLGWSDVSVAIARRVGAAGGALPDAGWPAPYTVPSDPDPSLTLSVMRQESSFDAGAVSAAGALGLMQIMPATARAEQPDVALSALTENPTVNIRLGTLLLKTLLTRYGSEPLAVAAYNAGARRVDEWLQTNGDPRVAGGPSVIDWIELIPFGETRNYVQRVLESRAVYAARAAR